MIQITISKNLLPAKKSYKKFIGLVIFGVIYGAGTSVSATELTLMDSANNNAITRGYEDFTSVGVHAEGLYITNVTISDKYTAAPVLSYLSDGPFNGSPVIPEESFRNIVFHGTFEDTDSPGNFINYYQIFVTGICQDYPGWSGVLTLRSLGNFTDTRQFRTLTCP